MYAHELVRMILNIMCDLYLGFNEGHRDPRTPRGGQERNQEMFRKCSVGELYTNIGICKNRRLANKH